MPCPCHAMPLRVQNVSFPFDLRSAAVSDSHLPCHAYESETWTQKKRDRKQLNIIERKEFGRILGPVCDNEKKIGGY